MTDFFDKLLGDQYKEAGVKLDESLLNIQEKYKAWFDDNIGQEEDPDKRSILYYKVVYINPPTITFKMDIDNLPEQIRDECEVKFREAYAQ